MPSRRDETFLFVSLYNKMHDTYAVALPDPLEHGVHNYQDIQAYARLSQDSVSSELGSQCAKQSTLDMSFLILRTEEDNHLILFCNNL